jgi:hypothetical protein
MSDRNVRDRKRVVGDDDKFFKRNPQRQYRIRRASPARRRSTVRKSVREVEEEERKWHEDVIGFRMKLPPR